MTNAIQKAWLVSWEDGRIGIAFVTESGGNGTREYRENDPDALSLRSALSDRDKEKLDRHLRKIVPFRSNESKPGTHD